MKRSTNCCENESHQFRVQSFVDNETAAVGRLHTEQQCEEEINACAAGIHDINVDLIAGLPHQTGGAGDTRWNKQMVS